MTYTLHSCVSVGVIAIIECTLILARQMRTVCLIVLSTTSALLGFPTGEGNAQSVQELTDMARYFRVVATPKIELNPPLQGKALEINLALQLPVEAGISVPTGTKVEVTYSVIRENDSPATDVTWVLPAPPTAPTVLTIFSQTSPMGSASLVGKPLFVEQRTNPEFKARRVLAKVRLISPFNVSGALVDIPRIELPLPTIPIPTILVLFSQRWYEGHRLVIVMEPSGLSAADDGLAIINAISALTGKLRSLVSAGVGLGWTVDQLDDLPGQIGGDETVYGLVVRRGDQFANLNTIELNSQCLVCNDPEAEDEIESIIMIGPQNREVRLYNKRDFSGGEGQLRLWTDHRYYVGVESLGPDSESDFDTDPNDLFNFEDNPSGWRQDGCCRVDYIADFKNQISSLRFRMH